MTLDSRQKLKLRKLLFGVLVALMVMALVLAFLRRTEWIVPEEAARRENPIHPSHAGMRAARVLYQENCARCHGDTGKGDGPEAWKNYPSPADLANSARAKNATDGALFYQISEGRRPMPGFKKRMTEQQRWELVNLVRSFAAK